MLIWRECLVLGDVRPVSTAASEHGVGWGGGGWGGLITFMSAAGRMWCYGMLRCEDVEVTSGTLWMLRCEDVEVTSGTLWMLRCEDVSNFRDALDATLWRCWSNFRDALDATLWRCWSNFRDALDATLWRCWSNFRDALDATLWRCWSNFRDALDATLWRCWNNFRDKIGLGLDLLQELGKLMKSIDKKIGYWKWADRRCKKASNVFREYVFEIHFFQKSRFRYSKNDTKLILRRASNVFEPFFNIDRARFMNKVLRFTGNCALNL